MKKISYEKALEKIGNAYIEIIDTLHMYHGLDWTEDPNFDGTPGRCARSLLNERCIGMTYKDKCKEILNVRFPSEYNGFIIASPITVSSLCPHHLENVTYKVVMGYIPSGNGVIGLSKIGRVIKLVGHAPILQENYVKLLADIFEDELKPEGIGVIVKGQHNCMIARGLQQPDVWVTMSEMRGSFRDNSSVKSEFLKLCSNDI